MPKQPYFFKAKSRLGLVNPPMRHQQLNIGVEQGPDYILSPEFLNQFPGASVSEFVFSKPEEVSSGQYYQVLALELKRFKELINQQIKPGETQVVIGGDNSVTFSALLAVMERSVDIQDIGYIQFDSHGEMHLFKSSLSKNFHGMYMRPFLDVFDRSEIEQLVPKKLKKSQVLTIGDLVFDAGDDSKDGEMELYRSLRNISLKEFKDHPSERLGTSNSKVKNEISEFINKHEHIHINFDIDIFDASVAGPSAMADEGVWFWEEVVEILEIIKRAHSLSLDIVEINPLIKGSDKTVKLAQDIMKKILI